MKVTKQMEKEAEKSKKKTKGVQNRFKKKGKNLCRSNGVLVGTRSRNFG